MIEKYGKYGRVRLYNITNAYNMIVVYLYRNGEIKTYWWKLNKKGKQKDSNKWRMKNKDYIRKKTRKLDAKYRIILNNLKVNGCAICGYNKYPEALDFHHVNPKDKKFNITMTNLNRKDKYIVEELNKCILLCANCHRELHAKEKEYGEDSTRR